jgi:hypothetical protein
MKILSLASLTVTGPCKPDNGADNSDNWNWIVMHVACAGYSFVKEKNKKGKNVCVDFASHTPARTHAHTRSRACTHSHRKRQNSLHYLYERLFRMIFDLLNRPLKAFF